MNRRSAERVKAGQSAKRGDGCLKFGQPLIGKGTYVLTCSIEGIMPVIQRFALVISNPHPKHLAHALDTSTIRHG